MRVRSQVRLTCQPGNRERSELGLAALCPMRMEGPWREVRSSAAGGACGPLARGDL